MQKVEITEIPKKLLQKLRFCRIIRVQKRTDIRLKGEREMKKSELKINTLYSKTKGHVIRFVYEWMGICNGKHIFRVYENLTTPTNNYISATDSDISELREIMHI